MTRLQSSLQTMRQSRGRLALSWEQTRGHWVDVRAKGFEELHQARIEAAARSFEAAIAELDQRLAATLKQLPE